MKVCLFMLNKTYKYDDIPLFQGIARDELEKMLDCLSARVARYNKGRFILTAGDDIKSVGIILSGVVQIIKEDADGNSVIITEINARGLFGESFACAGVAKSPISVAAAEDAEIMLIDYRRIVASCTSSCPFHTKLIENMLKLVAQKNLLLNQKIDVLSKRTIRGKVMCFLEAAGGGPGPFTIPYNREEMAQYLCADRSALSYELCRMRDEGIIKFSRNTFEIL